MSTIKIHVNQVALDTTGPKQAIVSYEGSLPGAFFYLLDEKGDQVFTGELEVLPAIEEWTGVRQYKQADFSRFTMAGTYRVAVPLLETAGEQKGKMALSAGFEIESGALFQKTLGDVLDYFKANRHIGEGDRRIRIINTDRYVNVWGGWKDAGGDPGKYLSHLTYSNHMTPQQASLAVWALSKSYSLAANELTGQKEASLLLDEVFWGADYLHRILDAEGYFYLTVFDQWGNPEAERMVTGYKGIEGIYTDNYKAAFREGAGLAIAGLARAAVISNTVQRAGQFSANDYLKDAKKAYAHLKLNNKKYCDDGKENIIDDYTALLAAVELYNATEELSYLSDARIRAQNLLGRLSDGGWFISDDGDRPYFHAAEAGLPFISLLSYLNIEQNAALKQGVIRVVFEAFQHQLNLNAQVPNPFDYARQNFKTYQDGQYSAEVYSGFFIPHKNETNYWWQGENARLASLSLAAVMANRVLTSDLYESSLPNNYKSLALTKFAQSQLDWVLGRNPYDVCMLYGFGVQNPPYAQSGGEMVKGGISNGITGAVGSDQGRGIAFAAGPESNNWRWVEQWIPHASWYLLTIAYMQSSADLNL